jgi:zinc-ribbon domain
MFCPHCGKSNSTEIKFCRSCGLSLDKVKESLAEQLPFAEPDNQLRDKQRRVERLLTFVIGSAFTVFVLAILWALIYKIIIVKGEILEGSIFLGLFVALVAALLMVVYRESLRESIAKRRMSQLSSSENKTTGKLPEPSFEPIASVTERTTSLLFTKDKSERKS